jgi:uncharacterized protein (DUF2252 family)
MTSTSTVLIPRQRAVRLTREQRIAEGKAARSHAPLESQAEFEAATPRDPVRLLLEQGESRVPELVPVRHGRMMVSPFTYYRGAALPMAADLSRTTTAGLQVQLCGDAHLSNFGVFGSPERRLLFDLNDFDETLPGPFEWDVKRLVASMVVAARENGLSAKRARRIAVTAGAAYREAMRDFATQPYLDVWYAHLDVERMMRALREDTTSSVAKNPGIKNSQQQLDKIRTRDSTQAASKLTSVVDGRRRIVSDPPLIVPIEEIEEFAVEETYSWLGALLDEYTQTLAPERRHLVERFDLTGVARKVVGVGSVGTRAWILLLESEDDGSPLLLQAKEAQDSVLADYAGKSEHDNQGQRVVVGQHMMQSASDVFLGWQRVVRPDAAVHIDYYVRQLRDWKYSLPIEKMKPSGLELYARVCGWTLARAHARSGDRVAIAAYLGKSDRFEEATADFAERYADLNERDHADLVAAVASGRVQAQSGL